MTRIFLSYCHADLAQVERLAEALQRAGHEVWFDKHGVRAGESIPTEIERELERAEVMGVCLSEASKRSEWCQRELSTGHMRSLGGAGLRLIPIRFEEVRLPPLLSSLLGVDLFPETAWEEGVSRLFDSLQPRREQPAPVARPAVPLPPNNLPPPPPLFVGREDELRRLREALLPRAEPGAPDGGQAALHGLGGMGKSSIALTFAHREAASFPGGIYWIQASGSVRAALALLASELQLLAPPAARAILGQLPPDAPPEARGRAAVLALQNQPAPSLLILDGADAPDWRAHLPAGRARVLLTTRSRVVALGTFIPVEPLSLERARELADLIHVPSSPDEHEARERVLEQVVRCHPLAVTVAARAQVRWNIPWPRLEQELRNRPTRVLDDAQLREGYPEGVFSAIDWALERCEPTEYQFLEATAVFAPERVPLDWVTAVAGLDPMALETRRALHALASLALMGATGQHEAMLHPLVWRRVRERLSPARREELTHRMDEVLRAWLAPMMSAPQLEHLPELDRVRPHLEEALREIEGRDVQRWLYLVMSFSTYLVMRADYGAARPLCEQALARAEQLPGSPTAYVAPCLINLANILHHQGEEDAAASLTRRARMLLEQSGPDDPVSLPFVVALAGLLRKDNPFVGEELARWAVERLEATHGPEALPVAEALENQAANVELTRGSAAAGPLYERVLAILEKNGRRTTSGYAAVASRFADIRRRLGDLQGAQRLCEQSLDVYEKILPPGHPLLAGLLTDLAAVLVLRGEAARAIPLLERAVRIRESRNDLEPKRQAATLFHLGQAHLRLRDFGRAETAFLEGVRTLERAHQDTGTLISELKRGLAQACRALGREAEALRHEEGALDAGMSLYEPVRGPGEAFFHQGLRIGHIRGVDTESITAALSESSELAEKAGDRANAARAALLLGKELHKREVWAPACARLKRGLGLLNPREEPVLAAESHRLLGDAHARLRHFKEARDSYKKALGLYTQLGLLGRVTLMQASLLGVLLMPGAPANQRRPLVTALRQALERGLVPDPDTRRDIARILQMEEELTGRKPRK